MSKYMIVEFYSALQLTGLISKMLMAGRTHLALSHSVSGCNIIKLKYRAEGLRVLSLPR